MKHVKVEMIHDLVCSWCPIGYNNLKGAADSLSNRIETDILFLPFELNPEMPAEGEDIAHLMHRRMGMGEQQIKNYRKNLISVGEAAGVHFDFSKRTHYYNTRVGHLVMHWAESKGKQLELNEALIPAYFSEGKNIGDMRVLNDILSSIGLDGDEARQALHQDAFSQSFKIKQQRVATLGVRSIPAFIVNDKHLVSGSNSVEFFKEMLIREATAGTELKTNAA